MEKGACQISREMMARYCDLMSLAKSVYPTYRHPTVYIIHCDIVFISQVQSSATCVSYRKKRVRSLNLTIYRFVPGFDEIVSSIIDILVSFSKITISSKSAPGILFKVL